MPFGNKSIAGMFESGLDIYEAMTPNRPKPAGA